MSKKLPYISGCFVNCNNNFIADEYYATSYGTTSLISCKTGYTIEDFKELIPTLEKEYECKMYVEDIEYSKYFRLDCIIDKLKDIVYTFMPLSPYQLLLGYNHRHEPIILDMRITPHVGVVGISNNGKSKCIELALSNLRGAEIHLINVFEHDFKMLKQAKRIKGEMNILDYLYYVSHETIKHEKPLYIVIDEYNVLNNLKGLDEAIENLLRQARHRNIFVIVIGQQMTRDECNFKNLFNCRLCFKQVSPINYYSFLGNTIDEPKLKQREFIVLHEKLEYGKSYLLPN